MYRGEIDEQYIQGKIAKVAIVETAKSITSGMIEVAYKLSGASAECSKG